MFVYEGGPNKRGGRQNRDLGTLAPGQTLFGGVYTHTQPVVVGELKKKKKKKGTERKKARKNRNEKNLFKTPERSLYI